MKIEEKLRLLTEKTNRRIFRVLHNGEKFDKIIDIVQVDILERHLINKKGGSFPKEKQCKNIMKYL